MSKRKPPSRSGRSASGRRGRRGARSLWRFAAWLLAALALFAVGAFFGERLIERGRALRSDPSPKAPAPAAAAPKPRAAAKRPADTPAKSAGERPLPAPRARIAIVIDDLGHDKRWAERLLALGLPFSYAVLPFEPQSVAVAELLRGRGAEILLHLPMEPAGAADPGAGALTGGMSPAEAADATRAALEAVPAAVGVNNHMGSAVTADRATMSAAIAALGEKGLFFLDSRTSAESVGYDVARAAGVPTARRDVFLDERDERAAIVAAIDRLVAIARAKGAAIGIAHPREATLAAFADRLPALAGEGIELVPVSFLLERGETLPE